MNTAGSEKWMETTSNRAGVLLNDLRADVCHRQNTPPADAVDLKRPPSASVGWPSPAALSIGQGSLHSECASFPWHTGALGEVSDSASARALSSADPAIGDQACKLLPDQACFFCSAPFLLVVRSAEARAFSLARMCRHHHQWLTPLKAGPKQRLLNRDHPKPRHQRPPSRRNARPRILRYSRF